MLRPLGEIVSDSLAERTFALALVQAFAVIALALAAIGLYGLMAYMVTRRSREIGIRIALGAAAGNVVWLVMREVLLLVTAGIVLGLPLAWGLTRLVQAQLYGIQPNDPLSIALATALLAGVALLAGYIPARRAASYDPVKVLRYE